MLQMLQGSASISFRLNNTILPALYALLKLSLIFLIIKFGLNHVLNFTIMTLFVLSKIFCITLSHSTF